MNGSTAACSIDLYTECGGESDCVYDTAEAATTVSIARGYSGVAATTWYYLLNWETGPAEADFICTEFTPTPTETPTATPTATPTSPDLAIDVMTFNTSNSSYCSIEESIRLCQGLQPDVALLQEWSRADGNYRAWVDDAFGSSFSYVRDSSGDGIASMGNGIVSRWPFLSSGSWDDVEVSGRWFDWAVIDIPGDINLQVVSVHLKATASDDSPPSPERRQTEATNHKTL